MLYESNNLKHHQWYEGCSLCVFGVWISFAACIFEFLLVFEISITDLELGDTSEKMCAVAFNPVLRQIPSHVKRLPLLTAAVSSHPKANDVLCSLMHLRFYDHSPLWGVSVIGTEAVPAVSSKSSFRLLQAAQHKWRVKYSWGKLVPPVLTVCYFSDVLFILYILIEFDKIWFNQKTDYVWECK